MKFLIFTALLIGFIKPCFSQESFPISEEIREQAQDTISLEGNEDLIAVNVKKLSLALNSVSNNQLPVLEIRKALNEHIKTRGVYEGLVLPSLRVIDGFYASNRGDLAKFISPIIYNINPSIGKILEERFGLPLDTNLENDFSRFRSSYKLGTFNDGTLNRGPIFGTPGFIAPPATVDKFDGCIEGCNEYYTPGTAIGGVLGTIFGSVTPVGPGVGYGIGAGAGGIIACGIGCVMGMSNDKPKPETTKPVAPVAPVAPMTCRNPNCK